MINKKTKQVFDKLFSPSCPNLMEMGREGKKNCSGRKGIDRNNQCDVCLFYVEANKWTEDTL